MSEAELLRLLRGPRARIALRRAAPPLAILCAGAAIGVSAGLGLWGLISVPLSLLTLAWAWPSAVVGAREIDRAGGLEGAVECGWDHRTALTPMAVAQRRRVISRLGAAPIALRGPSPMWLLSLGLWALPFVIKPPASSGGEVADAHRDRAAGSNAPDGGPSQAQGPDGGADGGVGAGRRTAKAGTKGSARRAEDAGVGERGQPGAATGQGTVGGVGSKAGDTAAAGPSANRVGRRLGFSGLKIGRGRGPAKVVARGTADAPPVAPTQLDDDVTDPARVYPARYRGVVGAYFSQIRAPRPR